MKSVVFSLLLVLGLAWGQKEEKKRSAGAHEHGSGKLGLAFEGQQGKFEWEIPLESIVGFEYEPTTPKDKQRLAEALAMVRVNFSAMVLLPPKAGCVITVTRAEAKYDKHGDHLHSDLDAEGTILCKQNLRGEIRFAFRKFFPGVHKTAVQVVSDQAQTGAEIVDDRGVVNVGN